MFKIDFIDGKAIKWEKKDGEAVKTVDRDYRPSFYVSGEDLMDVRVWISGKNGVRSTCFESWRLSPGSGKKDVLRVDVESQESFMDVVYRVKDRFARTRLRFYNVDPSPQFRYCLQNRIRPMPEDSLEKVEIALDERYIADKDISELEIDGEKVGGGEKEVKKALRKLFDSRNPDIVVLNQGNVLSLLEEKLEFSLGRIDGFKTLASGNTVESFGKTLHSSARYNIPGRIVIDRSNSFMLGETNIEGLWDLVDRSWKPLQELSWGSIGNILTAIEVRRAFLDEDTLTAWKNWEGEKPKSAKKLHRGDRGGFIFNPEPGVHEEVYEVDFSSLYPNIMVEKNISPETVNCGCCQNGKVPELDFDICDNEGFIPRVLRPLVKDRAKMKNKVKDLKKKDNADGSEIKQLEGSIDAIKWILVSCFGYMGHKHASYGAIRCHQAINAYDREIMVEAKQIVEENGYDIRHGIVDSIWITPREDPTAIEKVCRDVSREIGIELEHEHSFEWVAFVPRKNSNIATLNRYFGKKKSGGFKTAGIEMEQRSTCDYVKSCQKDLIEVFDKERNAERVLDRLEKQLEHIESGKIDTSKLVINRRCSKSLEEYSQYNRTVAALERSKMKGIEKFPGQNLEFVVANDKEKSLKRVRLSFENTEKYDEKFYKKRLIRAAESILSPLGWKREKIRSYISDEKETKVTGFC